MGTAANVPPPPDQPPADPYKKRIEANKVYAVLYVHDGDAVQVLLIEDGHKVNAGKVDLLGFPGGQIDDDYRTVRGLHGRARNELDLIHAIRETKEETGLDLRYEDVTFLHRVRVDGIDRSGEDRSDYVAFVTADVTSELLRLARTTCVRRAVHVAWLEANDWLLSPRDRDEVAQVRVVPLDWLPTLVKHGKVWSTHCTYVNAPKTRGLGCYPTFGQFVETLPKKPRGGNSGSSGSSGSGSNSSGSSNSSSRSSSRGRNGVHFEPPEPPYSPRTPPRGCPECPGRPGRPWLDAAPVDLAGFEAMLAAASCGPWRPAPPPSRSGASWSP
jgi:8-oxo-dGTP pyrophosphatase MutT (NUDIX family)